MPRKYNLMAGVIFITLVEGLVIYLNLLLVPELQPTRTAVIVVVATVANGLMAWYLSGK